MGREIIQQVLSVFHDNRTDIIGVIYPNSIADQLKYFLYHYAKLSNNRLVILDRDFMLKLLDSYIEECGMSPRKLCLNNDLGISFKKKAYAHDVVA